MCGEYYCYYLWVVVKYLVFSDKIEYIFIVLGIRKLEYKRLFLEKRKVEFK